MDEKKIKNNVLEEKEKTGKLERCVAIPMELAKTLIEYLRSIKHEVPFKQVELLLNKIASGKVVDIEVDEQ